MFLHAGKKGKFESGLRGEIIMFIQLKVIFTYSGGVLQSMMET